MADHVAALSRSKIKSNQIALLAKAPLIRSTGAPSTGRAKKIIP